MEQTNFYQIGTMNNYCIPKCNMHACNKYPTLLDVELLIVPSGRGGPQTAPGFEGGPQTAPYLVTDKICSIFEMLSNPPMVL